MQNKEEKSENSGNQNASVSTGDQPVNADIDEARADEVLAQENPTTQPTLQDDTNQQVGISSSEKASETASDVPVTSAPIDPLDTTAASNPKETSIFTPEQGLSEDEQPITLDKSPNPATSSASSASQNDQQQEPRVITKEVIREVPVERIVEREVIKEIPVEKIVYREVPVEKIVEKIVTKEIPVEKIIEREIKVFDQEIFKEEIKKRALSLLPKALQSKKLKRDNRVNKILEYIQKEKTATSGQLQDHLKLSAMTVFRYTSALIKSGKINFQGKRRSRIYIAV